MANSSKNNGTRYCKTCGEMLVKNGKHPNGKQRWLCRCCKSSLIHRVDYKEKYSELCIFHKWITNQATIGTLFDKSRWTFQRHTSWCWNITPVPKIPDSINVLVADGTYIKKGPCCIVAKADGYIVNYVWCKKECKEAYIELFSKLPRPTAIVTDGFEGCISAAGEVYKSGINILALCVPCNKVYSSSAKSMHIT
jgi:hypothetical protein